MTARAMEMGTWTTPSGREGEGDGESNTEEGKFTFIIIAKDENM